jgi:hypothetical protein
MNISKRVIFHENDHHNSETHISNWEEEFESLERWIVSQPIYYQMQSAENNFVDRYLNLVNEVYHISRLKIMKTDFLNSISSGFIQTKSVVQSQESAHAITRIARSFLGANTGYDPTFLSLQRIFYIGGLYHILLGAATQKDVNDQIYAVIAAINKISPSNLSETLLYCITDHVKCISELQDF